MRQAGPVPGLCAALASVTFAGPPGGVGFELQRAGDHGGHRAVTKWEDGGSACAVSSRGAGAT